jgi:hypothetical protein
MLEFIQAIVTQGWLWAALLILMLLFALDKERPWLPKFRLEIICAISLAVGLFIVGMFVFAMMTSPSAAMMAAADPVILMP